jgi:hypothetical protein
MSQIRELYAYQHKNITIYVDIDYRNSKISLVEPESWEKTRFKDKQWLFAGRGLAYVQGWMTILDGMKEAIRNAEFKLQSYKNLKDKKEDEMIIDLMIQDEKREVKSKKK